MRPEYHVALDVGGTNARIAMMQSDGSGSATIVEQGKLQVPAAYEDGISAILGLISEITGDRIVAGVGGAFAGQVQADGTLRAATNIPDWNNKPIRNDLEQHLHVPVKLINDVAAAAMGEAAFGLARDIQGFVFMIWGTGIGGAKVERLLDRFHITTFEPGHHIANPEGAPCTCGLWGCPEMMIGGGALSERLARDLSDIKDDDPVWDDVARIAGQTVINTLAFHQARLLVFGGGLILKRPFLLDKITQIVSVQQDIYVMPDIKITKLGDDAALYGAVALHKVELI